MENADLGSVKNKKILKVSVILFIIFLVLAVSSVCVYIHIKKRNEEIDSVVNNERFYNGIIIAGEDLSGKTLDEARSILLEREKSIFPENDVNISVVYDGQSIDLNLDDFVVLRNTEEILNEAYSLYRNEDEDKHVRYKQIVALGEEPKHYDITATIDKSSTDGAIKKVSDYFNIDPREAKVDSFDVKRDNKFTYKEGADGRVVEESKLKEDIVGILDTNSNSGTVYAEVNVVPNTVSIEDVKKRTVLIGKFSTKSSNTANANHNMSLALNFINGKVVDASGTFSFNDNTGDTNSGKDGYKVASAISGGKYVQEYGGGICQAATTLYGAAIRANMSITERHNHQFRSSYVDCGLDATVYSPNLDLCFRNDTDYPVYLGCYMSGTVLVCEIYGFKGDWYDYIEPESHITKTIPQPDTKYVDDYDLKEGSREVSVYGREGYLAEACRVYYKNSSEVKRESLPSSNYDAVATVIKVGKKN